MINLGSVSLFLYFALFQCNGQILLKFKPIIQCILLVSFNKITVNFLHILNFLFDS